MGSLIASRVINNLFAARDVFVTGHRQEKLEELARLGIQIEQDNRTAAGKSDVLLIAVKPKHMLDVCTEINDQCNGKLVISIAAGITINAISRIIENAHIIRAMPNMAAAVGESFTGLATRTADEIEKAIVRSIFESFGKCEFFEEEKLDAITGISGSGPAFLFYLAKAFIDIAVEANIDKELARAIAAQTMLGAAKLISGDHRSLDEMITFVASKGGTTEAGLAVADQLGLDHIMKRVLLQAIKRAEEIKKLND